jgi:hypothetical protein
MDEIREAEGTFISILGGCFDAETIETIMEPLRERAFFTVQTYEDITDTASFLKRMWTCKLWTDDMVIKFQSFLFEWGDHMEGVKKIFAGHPEGKVFCVRVQSEPFADVDEEQPEEYEIKIRSKTTADGLEFTQADLTPVKKLGRGGERGGGRGGGRGGLLTWSKTRNGSGHTSGKKLFDLERDDFRRFGDESVPKVSESSRGVMYCVTKRFEAGNHVFKFDMLRSMQFLGYVEDGSLTKFGVEDVKMGKDKGEAEDGKKDSTKIAKRSEERGGNIIVSLIIIVDGNRYERDYLLWQTVKTPFADKLLPTPESFFVKLYVPEDCVLRVEGVALSVSERIEMWEKCTTFDPHKFGF